MQSGNSKDSNSDASRALRVSEDRYRQLFESTQDGILLLNADTAQIEDVNPSMISMLGYSHEEFLGRNLCELGSFADRVECRELLSDLQDRGAIRYDSIPLISKSGTQIDVEFICNAYDCEGIRLVQCNIRDISERNKAQIKAHRNAQLYAALSQCNKAIVQSSSENDLFLKICQAAVEYGNMKMAWVGLIDKDAQTVKPAGCFGEHTEYLDYINIPVDKVSSEGRGPIGIAINQKQPYWCQDFLNDPATTPWHAPELQFGWGSVAALPLYREGVVTGALALYAGDVDAFDDAARDLLVEMAMDVSYALDNLEREAQRQRTNAEIEFKNTILRTQQETSLDAILVVDDHGGIISYSQQFIDLWNLSPRLITEETNAPAFRPVLDQLKKPEVFLARVKYLYEQRDEKSRMEMQLKDGRVIDRYSAPMTNASGKYYGRVWYFREITQQKRAEEALKDIAARYHTVFELSSDAILLLNKNGFFDCNEAALRMFGCAAHENLINNHPALLSPPVQPGGEDSLDLADQYIATALKNGSHRFEWLHRRFDGTVFPTEILLTAMELDGEQVLQTVIRDITERKRVERELTRNVLRHEGLMDTSFDGIHLMDEQGNIVEANDAFCKMLGYTQEEMMHLNITDWDAQWSAEELQGAFKEFVGKSDLLETVHRRKDGSLINVELSASGVNLDGNNYFFGASRDITERKRAEKELLIAATAFEAQEGIIVTDPNNVILRVNTSFTRLTGYTAEEAIGQTPSLLHSGMQDSNFYKQMWQDLKRDQYWHGEIWNRRKNGEIYPEWLNISAVLNSEGQVTNYIGSFTDITERKTTENRVEHLAFYDHLTDLPNRRLILDRLQHTQAASVRHANYSAVIFIDLDNFKILNDTRGHSVGDLFLIEVASRLGTCVRNGDTVARLGGDEFIILLEKLSEARLQAASQAEIVCEKILTAFNQPFLLNEYKYHSSASIGVCLFRGYEASVDELLKRADTAMYQAKSEGRNTLCFYDPVMQADLQARTSLTDDLRIALQKNQFRLYYQMQVDHAGLIVGAETLIRWQHPQRGLVPPMDFIPLAEEIGLITFIGQWVLDTACAQLKRWGSDPRLGNLRLAVNVSARQFHQDDFVEKVLQAINAHAINPGMLKLELTESLVLDNIEETIVKMRALKKLGLIFSMDDFGTGYSSLSYLTQLPLDQLKIDQSFVRNMEVQHSDEVIVQTIIGMAHNLGMEVIAEGVETKEQRDFLEQHGCVFYQGYLFGKPVPVEEFESVLKKA